MADTASQIEYEFTEWREYLHRDAFNPPDPIEEYQFTFNKKGIHAGVARRKSGNFDIYHNGNFIDRALQPNTDEPAKISSFMVTFDRIYFHMNDGN